MNGRTPRRRSSMPVRVFTLDEANRMLPRIVEEVDWFRESVQLIIRKQDALAVLNLIGASDPALPEYSESLRAKKDLDHLVWEYNERLERFHKFGCLIKDINLGLVDFYGVNQGRLIFFCWKYGEKTIDFWHEINGGFIGRRSVEDLPKD